MFSGIIVRSLYLASLPLVLIAFIIPGLFFLFPSMMQHIFFLNFMRYPFVDYYNLSGHGVRSRGRNFYLYVGEYLGVVQTAAAKQNCEENSSDAGNHVAKSKETVAASRHLHPTLGVWHILPASLSANKAIDESKMERSLFEESHGVFIYLHGNSFDRSSEHRCELYNVLSEMDFHVLAIDYRGYGDSTGYPTEDGLNADAHAIFNYVRKHAPTKDIYFWGHSMGTGVATRIVAELSDAGTPPHGLVLESPFNNLRDVVRNHPYSTPFRMLPWFDWAVIEPMFRSGLQMSSDQRVKRITCPIMVLHSEDDHIIPIKLGRKLVESAKSAGRKVKLVEFEGDREFLHKFIHRAHELPEVVRQFLEHGQLPERGRGRTARFSETGEEGVLVNEKMSTA